MKLTTPSSTGSHARCLRPGCGRKLTSVKSVACGYGPVCRRRIREAEQAAELGNFHDWQLAKAREAIEQKAVIPSTREGLYASVSSDGVTVYLTDARDGSCTCKAAANGRRCYHIAAALILDAAQLKRRAA
jgi:hypothetical protein